MSSFVRHSEWNDIIAQPRYLHRPRDLPLDPLGETAIESQETHNEVILLSEEIVPALSGFPDVKDVDQLRARDIRTILIGPKETTVESAKFRYGSLGIYKVLPILLKKIRFWAKNMFKLETMGPDHKIMICHNGKPVAIRQKLFKILTDAHQKCKHGSRDKTFTQVRKVYSWVPKELIARFVKLCPTCQIRREGSRLMSTTPRGSSSRLGRVSRSFIQPSSPILRQESRTTADYLSHGS
ncbi:uncharacterized protein N7500_008702 [Penicillium coprophilum]|uniref:uncharacterized protein n=1 Tax=Penicillium coprophilum TaxID=36646 RepID=UPI0023963501|nr:uncharacterized protein N7500_008702 [Penicillium coprophilum]KAJ5159051.1 hypothetical protein N7500_008702 [Penicillium coprophilum]